MKILKKNWQRNFKKVKLEAKIVQRQYSAQDKQLYQRDKSKWQKKNGYLSMNNDISQEKIV